MEQRLVTKLGPGFEVEANYRDINLEFKIIMTVLP